MQDAKEEVRARLAIEDVIGEYVQLRRAGRSYKGLSPFSGERTPSFFVSPDKQIWHDFSSNKGGDIFAFVMEVEGLDFRDALEMLARKAGVELSMYQGDRKIAERKKRLLAAHDLAANYYQHCLLKNQHALEYVFGKRKLSKEVVTDFRIGYAPTSGEALVTFLSKKGFSRQELADAGLTNRFGGDLFRGRMMVPLMDSTGQVIGFTGRIIEDDPKAPKYLNTPQTLLYDKSRHVFGLSQAKEAIRAHDYAVVVEGNLDVVSSHQAGVRHVVATAGTALTEHHLKALKRLAGAVYFSFDGDKAGLAATERAIPIAQTVDVDIRVVSLPDSAKDPDELIQQSPAAWTRAIEAAEPVMEWVLRQYASREDIQTAAGKRAFTSSALAVVKQLRDPVEREHYVKKIAAMAETSVESVTQKQQQTTDTTPQKPRKSIVHTSESSPDQHDKQITNLLTSAAADVEIQRLFDAIDMSVFVHDDERALAEYLRAALGPIDTIPDRLQKYEKYVTMVLLNPDVDRVEWREANRLTTARDVIRALQANDQKHNKKEHLIHEEAAARRAGDTARADTLLLQINALIKGEK